MQMRLRTACAVPRPITTLLRRSSASRWQVFCCRLVCHAHYDFQANRRYTYFAQKADVEGQNDIAAVFRSTAEGILFSLCDTLLLMAVSGETGHALGHLEFLEECGDPATDEPFGNTELNLKSAIAGETHVRSSFE